MRPDTPSDPPRREIALPGGPVAYTDEGEGPPLIALHGLPGSSRDWRWLGPCVAPGARLIRVDLPGFGHTPLATLPDPGFAPRADLIVQLADALGLARFAVIGHSIGGPLALAVAARAPERVRALALVASVGLRPHRGYRKALAMRKLAPLLRVPAARRAMRPITRWAFSRFGFRGHGDDALAQTVAVLERLDFADSRALVRRLTAPTLVAWAADDPLVEPAISEELAQAVPDGPRLGFASGGHNIQKTRAVELGEALRALLRG